MASDLILKVQKAVLQVKITMLEGKISELESIMQRYQNLLNQLDQDVIERSDAEFQKTEDNVKLNIEMVRKSLMAARNAREAVQKTLDATDEYQAQANSVLAGAADGAAQAASAALNAFKAYD